MAKLVELGLGGGGASRSPRSGGGAPFLGPLRDGLQMVALRGGPRNRGSLQRIRGPRRARPLWGP